MLLAFLAFCYHFSFLFYRKPVVRSNSLKMSHTSSSTAHKNRNKQTCSAANNMTVTHFSPILRMGLPPCPDVNINQADQGNSAISKVSQLTIYYGMRTTYPQCNFELEFPEFSLTEFVWEFQNNALWNTP